MAENSTDRCAYFHESIRMYCGGVRATHSTRYADHQFTEGLVERLTFSTTKEAMLYAQRNHMPTVVPITGERVPLIAATAMIDSDLRLIAQQCEQIALHLYDHSIANAPLSTLYARETAEVIGQNLAAIQDAVKRMQTNSAKLLEKQ